jgi:DNA repair protein RecN (Recombination protein N)
LKRKYGLEEAGLVAKHAELKLALAELTDFDSVLEEKESAVKKTLGRLVKDTRALHDGREQAAKKISRKLEATLKDLALPHAKISWIVDAFPSPEEYKSYGGDRMRLMVSFNPGEELRPFEEIISGGELSRLLLAIYEILFSDSLLETFVFDEVDAGAGGGVAELIGRKLAALGQRAQVFCITHLPQIACQGQWHFSVEKAVRRGRTFSEIRLLNAAERVQEIARMLAGVEVTGRALEHAKELLKNYAA